MARFLFRCTLVVFCLATAGCANESTSPSAVAQPAAPAGSTTPPTGTAPAPPPTAPEPVPPPPANPVPGDPARVAAAVTISGPDTVAPGAEVHYSAIVRYSDGSVADATALAVWTSSHPEVLQIGPSGTALGRAQGVTEITASFGGGEQKVSVRVREPDRGRAVRIEIVGPLTLEPGGSAHYRATIFYDTLDSEDITASAVWSSTRTDVVQINPDGTAIGRAPGTSELSATKGGVTQKITVSVRDVVSREPAFLEISGPSTGEPGSRAQFRTKLYFKDGSSDDATASAAWTSSRTRVLRMSPDGSAVTLEPGYAQITARVGALQQTHGVFVLAQNTFWVYVLLRESGTMFAVPDASIVVESGIGAGNIAGPGPAAEYMVSGVAGDVRLRVSAPGYRTRTVDVFVTASTVAISVELIRDSGSARETTGLAIAGPDRLDPGASAQYRAMLLYSDGSTEDVTNLVSWSASGPPGTVLVINRDGSARAVGEGATLVWASLGKYTSMFGVHVLQPGTYAVHGAVTDGVNSFLSGATVEVVSGVGAGRTAVNNDFDQGFVLFGLAGPVRLLVSLPPTYQSRTVDVNVTETMSIVLVLTPVSAPASRR